jgi:transposase InsO family protein
LIWLIPSIQLFLDFFDLETDSATGDNCVLLAIDHFSKYVWAEPLWNKMASSVERFLLDLFRREGVWENIGTDNAKQFTAESVLSVYRQLGSKLVNGRPYHPQEQGVVERMVRTTKEAVMCSALCTLWLFLQIGKIIRRENGCVFWVESLPNVVAKYNDTQHSTTKATPFFAFRGRMPQSASLQLLGAKSYEVQAAIAENIVRRGNQNIAHRLGLSEKHEKYKPAPGCLAFVKTPGHLIKNKKVRERWIFVAQLTALNTVRKCWDGTWITVRLPLIHLIFCRHLLTEILLVQLLQTCTQGTVIIIVPD